jgi:3-methyladenine DNA glycosylase Tag
MSPNELVFNRIDELWKRIRKHAIEPKFSEECKKREMPPDYNRTDSQVLEQMINLIAFSQGARAERILAMINRGDFRDVFANFEPSRVAQMNPEDIRKKYWSGKLSPMRFPNKIDKMVECAKSIQDITQRNGSFMRFLQSAHLLDRLQSPADIDTFWNAFETARSKMPPYYHNFTSLCHFLQQHRFPCAKPDKVVMKVAAELGIVPERKQHGETELRNVVRFIQQYAISRGQSVPVVDFIFLIHGGQSWARGFVHPAYYA